MRKIGELPGKDQAIRFCDYLLTEGIAGMTESNSEDESSAWAVWVREEDQVAVAKESLQAFLDDPDAERFRVQKQADEIRKAQEDENRKRLELQQPLRGAAWQTTGVNFSKRPQLTIALVAICILMFFATDGKQRQSDPNGFSSRLFHAMCFVDPNDYIESARDPLASVKQGELWRLFSPNLLHGSMFHLASNMLGLFFFGRTIEQLQSARAMLFLTVFTGIVAILAQCVMPSELGGSVHVVGISGAILGLFGYLWIRPMLQPSFPNLLPQQVVFMILGFTIFFVIMEVAGQSWRLPIANVAHVAGLFAGMFCAWLYAQFNW